MPATKVQLDRVLAAYQQFQVKGKARIKSDRERAESEESLERAKREASERRNDAKPGA